MARVVRFYKYFKPEYVINTLRTSTLRFATADTFNDPFDIYPYYPKEGRNKHLKMVIEDIQAADIKLHGTTDVRWPIPKKQREKIFNSFEGKMRENLIKDLSVSCFSSSPSILPLWAHYGDNHKGCVLEFTVEESIIREAEILINKGEQWDESHLIPHQMKYSVKRPPMFIKEQQYLGEQAFDIFSTKDKSWEYEKEIRCFRTGPTSNNYFFYRKQLSKVIFGIKTSTDMIASIKNEVVNINKEYGLNVKIAKAALAPTTFEILIV